MRLVLFSLSALAIAACDVSDPPGSSGTVELALTGQSSSGTTYRLREGVLVIAGDAVTATFHTEEDPSRTAIITRLPAGSYTLALDAGWQLERVEADGDLVPVVAALTSNNPAAFLVEGGTLSRVTLRFRADGEDIPLGSGDVQVDIEVDDVDAGAVPDAAPAPDAAPPDAVPAPDATPDAAPPVHAVHVAPTGDDAAAGTAAQPLRTIAAAIPRAASCSPGPCEVRIAAGTYPEAITLVPAVSLYGGYSPDFSTRAPQQFVVRIRASSTRTVIADDIGQPTVLDGLTITGADAAEGSGGSTYALWVRGSDGLSLRDLRIEGGRGARRNNASNGALTACVASGGAGGESFECGASAGARGSASGDPVVAGQPGAAGISYCTNACPQAGNQGVTAGLDGIAGAHGTAGSHGAVPTDDDGAFTSGVWVGASGAAGARGSHGTGGGGGGSGGTKQFRTCFGCGSLIGGRGASGAPAGCGGGGGAPGGPGGGSFALVVVGSTIDADRVEIVGGHGGAGARGGDGHPGGLGGSDTSVGRGAATTQRCGLIDYTNGAGGFGGAGGNGGPGGGGPGGPGGPSIGVALVDGGQLVAPPGAVTIAVGVPGTGGAGGLRSGDSAARGPSGRAAAIVVY